MEIKLHSIEPGLVHVRCRGIITRPADERVEDPIEAVCASHGWSGAILLDLEDAEFLDSGGIAWLMHWHRRAKESGGSLALCSLSPRVRDVVQLCQLQRLLPIWEDAATARAQLLDGTRPGKDKNARLEHG